MLRILAETLKITTRSERRWDAPAHWQEQDHRTPAEKERDVQERLRLLRRVGWM